MRHAEIDSLRSSSTSRWTRSGWPRDTSDLIRFKLPCARVRYEIVWFRNHRHHFTEPMTLYINPATVMKIWFMRISSRPDQLSYA